MPFMLVFSQKAPRRRGISSLTDPWVQRTLSEAAFDSDEDGDAEFHVPKSTTNSSRKKAKSRADTPAAIKTEEVSDDLLT